MKVAFIFSVSHYVFFFHFFFFIEMMLTSIVNYMAWLHQVKKKQCRPPPSQQPWQPNAASEAGVPHPQLKPLHHWASRRAPRKLSASRSQTPSRQLQWPPIRWSLSGQKVRSTNSTPQKMPTSWTQQRKQEWSCRSHAELERAPSALASRWQAPSTSQMDTSSTKSRWRRATCLCVSRTRLRIAWSAPTRRVIFTSLPVWCLYQSWVCFLGAYSLLLGAFYTAECWAMYVQIFIQLCEGEQVFVRSRLMIFNKYSRI